MIQETVSNNEDDWWRENNAAGGDAKNETIKVKVWLDRSGINALWVRFKEKSYVNRNTIFSAP